MLAPQKLAERVLQSIIGSRHIEPMNKPTSASETQILKHPKKRMSKRINSQVFVELQHHFRGSREQVFARDTQLLRALFSDRLLDELGRFESSIGSTEWAATSLRNQLP
jgi:hypothetical protein